MAKKTLNQTEFTVEETAEVVANLNEVVTEEIATNLNEVVTEEVKTNLNEVVTENTNTNLNEIISLTNRSVTYIIDGKEVTKTIDRKEHKEITSKR